MSDLIKEMLVRFVNKDLMVRVVMEMGQQQGDLFLGRSLCDGGMVLEC